MFIAYVHWYYGLAPRWLLRFAWNLERALLNYFSVGLMLRTLFAHWRRDALAYTGGLGDMLMIFVWNQISRLIGALIRITVLGLWLIIQVLFIVGVIMGALAFILWPLALLLALTVGAVLMAIPLP